jgi:hypoxanthine phosphoribosyltransferase
LEALQELKQGYSTEFLRVSSYERTSSSSNVTVRDGLRFEHLENQHVILVQAIDDDGATLSQLLPVLKVKANPKSLQVATLLEKRLSHQPTKVDAKYKGFSIPNRLIVGYGLDYNELYRDVRDIWVLSEVGIHFDQSKLYPEVDYEMMCP